MRRASIIATIALLCLPGWTASASDVPEIHIRTLKQLPVPLPLPYDEGADATSQLNQAFERAKANGKRVLIDFGGNWCPDCRILAGVLALPEVRPFVDAHFEMVSVDVGRFDHNLDVAKALQIRKLTGVPWLVIIDAGGKILVSSDVVTDEHHRTPQSMLDWLARFAAPDR